jgi:plastocyanin
MGRTDERLTHEGTRRQRWRSRALVALTAVLILGTASPAFAETFDVRAARQSDGTGWRWRPKHVYGAEPGDYVRWRNPTSVTHNITSYNAGTDWSYSRTLAPGTTRRKQFNRRGTFYYRCTIHSALSGGQCSGQCGIIHV